MRTYNHEQKPYQRGHQVLRLFLEKSRPKIPQRNQWQWHWRGGGHWKNRLGGRGTRLECFVRCLCHQFCCFWRHCCNPQHLQSIKVTTVWQVDTVTEVDISETIFKYLNRAMEFENMKRTLNFNYPLNTPWILLISTTMPIAITALKTGCRDNSLFFYTKFILCGHYSTAAIDLYSIAHWIWYHSSFETINWTAA